METKTQKAVNVIEIVADYGAYVPKHANVVLKVARLESCYGIAISSDKFNFAYHLAHPILGFTKEQKTMFVQCVVNRYFKELPGLQTTKSLKASILLQDENYEKYLKGDTLSEEEKVRGLDPEKFLQILQTALGQESERRGIKWSIDAYFQKRPNPEYNRYHLAINEESNIYPYLSKSEKTPLSYHIYYHATDRKMALQPDYAKVLEELKDKQQKMTKKFYDYDSDDITQQKLSECVLLYTQQQLKGLTVPKTILNEKGEHMPISSSQYSELLAKKAADRVLWKHIDRTTIKPNLDMPTHPRLRTKIQPTKAILAPKNITIDL